MWLVVSESSVLTKGRFDYLGAALLSVALTSLLLAISKGGTWGWGSEPVIVLFVVAVAALVVWFPYEMKVGQPLVDLRTSARRPVLLTNIASLLVGFAMFANLLLTTQQLQLPPALATASDSRLSPPAWPWCRAAVRWSCSRPFPVA